MPNVLSEREPPGAGLPALIQFLYPLETNIS
jgi:hypothetical protein